MELYVIILEHKKYGMSPSWESYSLTFCLLSAFLFSQQISYCGICSKFAASRQILYVPTAVASVLLKTPILKNVMGIFGLMDASSASLRKHFKASSDRGDKEDLAGRSVVIYVGGIAELFKSSRKEERLYLSKRKGFIKLALQENVDIIPVYLFGNTSVLTVVKTGVLADLSRRLGVSLTYFWGKWYLPIPRDYKVRVIEHISINQSCAGLDKLNFY